MSKRLYPVGFLWASLTFANPESSLVLSGDVSFVQMPQRLEITASDRSIIEWNSFSIGHEESVAFIQPSSAAVVLNRVVGQDMSELLGALKANGIVYLINPRGILVGENGLIDTASFLASTLDFSNEAFIQGQELLLQGASEAPLIQLGTIQAREGDVLLMAHHICNAGPISAKGSASLTAGHEILLKPQSQPLLNIRPDLKALGIENSGAIEALSAYLQSDSLATLALQQKADIQLVEAGGQILLYSEGGPIHIDPQAHLSAPAGNIQIRIEPQEESKPVYLLGSLDVSGEKGGSIEIAAPKLLNTGVLRADGTEAGGRIDLFIEEALIETSSAKTTANGGKQGGTITYDSLSLFSSGSIHAQGETEGSLHLLGDHISLVGAHLNAQEHISIDGPFEDGKENLFIAPSSQLRANHIRIGSEETQESFTNAPEGSLEMLSVTSEFLQTPLVDPNAGSGTGFGNAVTVLSTGKIVVTKPNDNFAATAAGAVYLYNGETAELISTITGSTASDQIGSSGITSLTGNGNYVFRSPNWDNGIATNAGAVTWANGETGVSGTVSAANSLIGSTGSDQVGSSGVTALTNGNYVVISPAWDQVVGGTVTGVGATTWGDGTVGVTGTVSVTNSLIGSTGSDQVGSSGVTALTNGNYVVASSVWDRVEGGTLGDVGAATWGNGTTGITGTVSVTNSLIGSTANDQVAREGVVASTNGNYVIRTQGWAQVDGGTLAGVGAATWGNGTTGITGTVSVTNSLVGSTANDRVGIGATALTNNNYVIASPFWSRVDGGAAALVGAVTWGNGTTGVTGTVSVTNSLIGSTASDQVSGGVASALANGNYVVPSIYWDRVEGGTLANVGAATWGDGTTGITGTVSVTNSLIGSTASDQVGTAFLLALTNGNYVIKSRYWDRVEGGSLSNVGAATWGNGTTGITGTVSVTNSLIGSTANDQVSSTGLTALTNGNYVIRTSNWDRVDGGALADVGAATWGSGTTGITGTVSVTNSLIGSTLSDNVSSTNVTALSNGNYVVASPNWDRVDGGTLAGVGAATWSDGAAGITGTVSINNSLIGSTLNDNVSTTGVTALTNGNYVVASRNWDWVDQGLTNSGAATRGDGTTGITGTVTSANSVLGGTSSSTLQAAIDNNAAVPNTFICRFTAGQGTVIIGGDLSSTPTPTPSSIVIVGESQARIDYARTINESFQIWEYRLFGPYLSDDSWAPLETAKRLNLILPSLVH